LKVDELVRVLMVSGADDEAYTRNKRRIKRKRKRKRKKIERMWGGRECIAKVTVLRTDLLVHFTRSAHLLPTP
jgi:hypothetical protein